ncbi:GL24952 [Drosophila persimilis]|uniref:GL24952 n=1 Tax=Drosophila persimilis TaxID=7234 RepID=B4GRF2_DROPE|nr:GL24952 [Drosophila persimilis]
MLPKAEVEVEVEAEAVPLAAAGRQWQLATYSAFITSPGGRSIIQHNDNEIISN